MVLGTIVFSILVLATATYAILRAARLNLYRALSERARYIREEHPSPEITSGSIGRDVNFERRLIHFPDALPNATFAALRAEIETLVQHERSHVPSHKQGGTVAAPAWSTK